MQRRWPRLSWRRRRSSRAEARCRPSLPGANAAVRCAALSLSCPGSNQACSHRQNLALFLAQCLVFCHVPKTPALNMSRRAADIVGHAADPSAAEPARPARWPLRWLTSLLLRPAARPAPPKHRVGLSCRLVAGQRREHHRSVTERAQTQTTAATKLQVEGVYLGLRRRWRGAAEWT